MVSGSRPMSTSARLWQRRGNRLQLRIEAHAGPLTAESRLPVQRVRLSVGLKSLTEKIRSEIVKFSETKTYTPDIPEGGLFLTEYWKKLEFAGLLDKISKDDDLAKTKISYGTHTIEFYYLEKTDSPHRTKVGEITFVLQPKGNPLDVREKYDAKKACALQALVNYRGAALPAATAKGLHDFIWKNGPGPHTPDLSEFRNYDEEEVHESLYARFGVVVRMDNVGRTIADLKLDKTFAEGRFIFATYSEPGKQGVGHMVVAIKAGNKISFLQDSDNRVRMTDKMEVWKIFQST